MEAPTHGEGAADVPPVKLVATDLDGTLLRPDGTLSERTICAVKAAQDAGIVVIPITGRPPRITWGVAKEAGLGRSEFAPTGPLWSTSLRWRSSRSRRCKPKSR